MPERGSLRVLDPSKSLRSGNLNRKLDLYVVSSYGDIR